MRLSDLRILIELSQSNSITLTAEKLHISQQGLSRLVSRMEDKLHVQLFERSRNGITLTEAGELTVFKAKEIIEKYDELRKDLELLSSQISSVSGDLTIYHSHYSGTVILPRALKLFKHRYPDVNLILKENAPLETLNCIKKDPTAVGIINYPDNLQSDPSEEMFNSFPELEYQEIIRDDLIVCVPKSWNLTKKQLASADYMVKCPMVYFNTDQYLEIVSLIFKDAGGEPEVFLKTLNNELFRQTIIDGLAMGAISSLELSDHKVLKESTVQSPLRVKLVYTWVTSKENPMPIAAQKFLECFKVSSKN